MIIYGIDNPNNNYSFNNNKENKYWMEINSITIYFNLISYNNRSNRIRKILTVYKFKKMEKIITYYQTIYRGNNPPINILIIWYDQWIMATIIIIEWNRIVNNPILIIIMPAVSILSSINLLNHNNNSLVLQV